MDAYLGEIRIFGFNYAPRNWAYCNGALLPIRQYTALFSLLGTNYGGDGTTTFALPNYNGNAPMHAGNGPGLSSYSVGDTSGVASVTLDQTQMPVHVHNLVGGVQGQPANPSQFTATPGPTAVLSRSQPGALYTDQFPPNANLVPLSPSAILPTGGSQPHDNHQPSLVLNFCICLNGNFPARN